VFLAALLALASATPALADSASITSPTPPEHRIPL
jgi:hypothetical protein